MTTLTQEERQRICVAKFRDMSDEMLSEMPGTVMELAKKYMQTLGKFRKMSEMLIKAAEHLPPIMMLEFMAEMSAHLVESGEKTMDEVLHDLEEIRSEVKKEDK